MASPKDIKSMSSSVPELLAEAHGLEAKDRAFFSSIPWTAKLMEDSNFTNLPMISRLPQPETEEDSFLAETVNTPDTISHLLAYYRNLSAPNTSVVEVRWLIALGTKLNGWPNVMHGGMQSFLLDEIMGFMIGCSRRIPEATPLALNTVTAELKVRYLRAMRTPGTFLVEARLVKREGRKIWTEAEVKDEKGVVVANGEALFISVQSGTGPKV